MTTDKDDGVRLSKGNEELERLFAMVNELQKKDVINAVFADEMRREIFHTWLNKTPLLR
jgi:hypothetical protein